MEDSGEERGESIDEKTNKKPIQGNKKIRIKQQESLMFETVKGVRQRCILSPLLFTTVLDEVIKEAKTQAQQYRIWKKSKYQK